MKTEESNGKVKLLVKQGREGAKMSRLTNGKVVLFSDTDLMTPKLRDGDVVEAEITYDSEKYAIARALKIASRAKSKKVELKGVITEMRDGESGYIQVLIPDDPSILQDYSGKEIIINGEVIVRGEEGEEECQQIQTKS